MNASEVTMTALDLPEGLYAIPDPHTPDTITYWRRQDVRTRRQNLSPRFGAWPPKARPGPVLYKSDVPAGLHGQDLGDWMRTWYAETREPYDTAVVAAIAADPITAGRRFAELTVRCCQCARPLTDALSKAYGIGPDCRHGMDTEILALYLTPQELERRQQIDGGPIVTYHHEPGKAASQ